MSDDRPWEESPDEGYWQNVLGETAAHPSSNGDGNVNPVPSSIIGWTLAEASYKEGKTLELRVVGHNRGGLIVDLGDVRGFVPASQLVTFPRPAQEEARMQELARYMNTTLRLKVIEFDRERNRLILSERIANPPSSRADQLIALIQPQETRHGVVRNITDFGAFVDLGGIEGLIHVSELSWQYVAHPRDVLTAGQEIEVYVMEVNREQKRIACSLKRLKPNPWAEVAEKIKPGDWVTGEVTSVVPFGAFVRIAEGVEGLLHISELAEGNFLHPRDVVREGQSLRVRVIEIDANQQRMKLSLRQPNGNGNGSNTGVKWAVNPKSTGNHSSSPPPPPPDPGYWQSLADST